MAETVLDEALARFAATGPEFGGGLSNHGPMAAEALVALGRGDAVEGWSDGYIRELREHPEARNPIDTAAWREALGDMARVGDWIVLFERELVARPWREVLETWTARLAPGLMAGATHGIIRTAHAVRTLSGGETPARLHELAEGLGYWAARYRELPGAAGATPGQLEAPDALPLVVLVPPEDRETRGFISAAAMRVERVDFAPVVNLIGVEDVDAALTGITRTFVRQYLANAQRASIAFVHTVTAPAAVRLLAPHLGEETRRLAVRYGWQACAAIYSGLAAAPAVAGVWDDGDGPVVFDEADLVEQAVASGDEHAIKFTEACLREYGLTSDPAFIAAARDVVVRLGRAARG